MPDFELIDPENLTRHQGHDAPFCTATGDIWSRSRFPEDFGQFVVYSNLTAGATITWDERHGDEGVYVLDGEIEVNGQHVSKAGAAVIESHAPAVLRAATDCHLLHVGSTVPEACTASIIGAPQSDGHSVHVYGPRGSAFVTYNLHDRVDHGAYFTDSHCATCRISLFHIYGSGRVRNPTSHVHTAHELITVVEGALRIGRVVARPVMTLAIPGGRRYGFTTTDEPWGFVNFRSDASYIEVAPGSELVLESCAMLGEVSYV